jgi:hypothetical protein
MNVKNYGFIIKGPDYDWDKDNVCVNSKSFSSTIIAVSSLEEACKAADNLVKLGVDVIELCGWFGKEWYKKISSHVHNKVPVGYVIFEKD